MECGTSFGPALAAGGYAFWSVVWLIYLTLIIVYFEKPDHDSDIKETISTTKPTLERGKEPSESTQLLLNPTELSFRSTSSENNVRRL